MSLLYDLRQKLGITQSVGASPYPVFNNGVSIPASKAVLLRANLVEEALAEYPVLFTDLKNADLTAIDGTGADGKFSYSGSNGAFLIKGEEADNETETSVLWFFYALKPGYVSQGDVKVRLATRVTGAGTLGTTKTIDVSAYKLVNGVLSADLCTTAAQTLVAGTSYANNDFVVSAVETGAELSAGSMLAIKVTAAVQESTAGTSVVYAEIGKVSILADTKG